MGRLGLERWLAGERIAEEISIGRGSSSSPLAQDKAFKVHLTWIVARAAAEPVIGAGPTHAHQIIALGANVDVHASTAGRVDLPDLPNIIIIDP